MSDTQHDRRTEMMVSCVSLDSTIVETVFDPARKMTSFVVSVAGETPTTTETWERDGRNFRPPRASNNLIAHRAILFPSEPTDIGSVAELVAEIRAYIDHYVSLPPGAVELCVAYVLLSWVHDAFQELPYLRFRGDYGTGKSRALLIVGSIAYKLFFASGASTVSPIFHTLDAFRSTLILDEADFRFSDEKAELAKIFNNGNVDGFPVLRTQITKEHEFDPRAFVVFGPKIVGMRGRYEDRALESRFLTVEMEPGKSGGRPLNMPDEQAREALALRNKLLTYRLRNRLSTRLDPTLADPGLEPRMNQILVPLLSVCPTSDLREAVLATALTLQAGTVADRGATAEGQVLSIIARLLPDRLRLADISSAFATEFGGEYERPVSNRWIGALLRRLGIALYKTNGVYAVAPGQRDRLAGLYHRYGITSLEGAGGQTAE